MAQRSKRPAPKNPTPSRAQVAAKASIPCTHGLHRGSPLYLEAAGPASRVLARGIGPPAVHGLGVHVGDTLPPYERVTATEPTRECWTRTAQGSGGRRARLALPGLPSAPCSARPALRTPCTTRNTRRKGPVSQMHLLSEGGTPRCICSSTSWGPSSAEERMTPALLVWISKKGSACAVCNRLR